MNMTSSGFIHSPGALDAAAQAKLLEHVNAILAVAPYFTPRMPRTGKPFSVRMTNCGWLGWVSDREGGYRYQHTHPETEQPWPPIPDVLMGLWEKHTKFPAPPEACLINYYGPGAKMGSHRDADENEPRAPVLSVSLGDDAVFHVGGPKRGDPKSRVVLKSGDVAVLGGQSRFAYHGIDKVVPGTSTLLAGGGRINFTLRRVTAA
jgi:DNA oxidative demethylase